MNIVLIPCYNRPEFLKVCLEHIKNANGADKLHYHFAVEHGAHPDIHPIIQSFNDSGFSITSNTRPVRTSKYNNENILFGYKEAFDLASRYNSNLIYQIEEDIFISKGFFDFHEEAHRICPDAFSVSTCHNQNWDRKVPRYINKVYYHDSFQSLGISFRKQVVENIITHCTPEFFKNPMVLDQMFPASKITGMHYDQDGLIHRIQEASGMQSVYACNPLSYHAGFYGINRAGKKLSGSTDQKAEEIRKMTAKEMNDRAQVYKDIRPCNLNQECVYPLSVFTFDFKELEIDTTPPQILGYDPKWLKKGIKVRSKK